MLQQVHVPQLRCAVLTTGGQVVAVGAAGGAAGTPFVRLSSVG
jgi:hypothetical protein